MNLTRKIFLGLIISIFSVSMATFEGVRAQEEKSTVDAPANQKIKAKKKKAIRKKIKAKKSQKRRKKKNAAVQRKSAVKVNAVKKKRKRNIRKSLQSWLKKMKNRVARSKAKHNQLVSVAAVRGDKKPDSPPLYWKGKKSEGPVELPELKEFDEAIAIAIRGNKKEAIDRLEKFVAQYPSSSLSEDAHHTLVMLNNEDAPNPEE